MTYYFPFFLKVLSHFLILQIKILSFFILNFKTGEYRLFIFCRMTGRNVQKPGCSKFSFIGGYLKEFNIDDNKHNI